MDTAADFLTSIRNALAAGHQKLDVPASNMRKSLATILEKTNYIRGFHSIDDSKQGIMRIYLKYSPQGEPAIGHLRRVSKSSCRHYVSLDEIPVVRNHYGECILNTNKGVMTGAEARKQKVGGEVICEIW